MKDATVIPAELLPGGLEIFKQIAEHSHIGIWLLRADGTNFYGNPAAYRIWGGMKLNVSPGEYQEFHAWDFVTGERLKNEDWAGYKARISGEPVLDHLIRIQRFNGEYGTILNSAIPVKCASGKIQMILILNHDVTEHRASEAKREELVRIVSHDIKNPLHAIQMTVQLLSRKLERFIAEGQEEKIRHYVNMIDTSTSHCLGLVKDFLNVAGVNNCPFEMQCTNFSPAELFDSLRPIYDPLAAQKGLRLLWQAKVNHKIFGDKERINQVVSNIVGNAIKFTPAGGEIKVLISECKHEILFEISDTGPGINKEHIQKIFQKEYKVIDAPQGTGLGLYIAQTIVNAHGGSIWADSVPDQGSQFFFTLPFK